METTAPLTISSTPNGAIVLPGLVVVQTSPTRNATLIARDLIVMASHYAAYAGTAVTAQDGKPSVIGGIEKQFADVIVFRLNTPLDSIAPAKIASEQEVKAQGAEFIGTGFANINTAQQQPIAAKLAFQKVQADSAKPGAQVAFFKPSAAAKAQPGDSGSPIYVKVGSEYKVAAVWTDVNKIIQPASLLYPVKAEIEAIK